MHKQENVLRLAFAVGAVTDALAVLPMVIPSLADLLWGFEDASGSYRFAMGYAASLMLGWTGLLVWAWQSPIERRFVAALTIIVIYGLIATEIVAVATGSMPVWRMVPTWILQAGLLTLFAAGFHYERVQRWGLI